MVAAGTAARQNGDTSMANAALDRPGPTRDSLETWNYKAMLGAGTSYTSAFQVADPKTVMPFLYVGFGAPVLFVGLLFPFMQVATMVTQFLGAPVFGSHTRSKHNQILSYFLMGGALALLGLLAPRSPGMLLVLLFMGASAIIGCGQAINLLAWTKMAKRILSDDRRSMLLYVQTGLAGALTVPIALLLHAGIHFPNALDKHMMLLWAGAGITLVAGLFLFFIREVEEALAGSAQETVPPTQPETPTDGKSFLEKIRTQYFDTLRTGWFRHYLLARMLLLTVELAPPFYAIHAASLHGHSGGSLNIFVVANGLAFLVSAPLWRWAGRFSEGKVMALAALTGAAAGIWAIAIEFIPSMRDPLTYAVVFFLIALATAGVVNARTCFLIKHAPHDRQSFFVGFDNGSAMALGIVVALAFGAMAHVHGAIYAIGLIVGLNVLAMILAARLRRYERA